MRLTRLTIAAVILAAGGLLTAAGSASASTAPRPVLYQKADFAEPRTNEAVTLHFDGKTLDVPSWSNWLPTQLYSTVATIDGAGPLIAATLSGDNYTFKTRPDGVRYVACLLYEVFDGTPTILNYTKDGGWKVSDSCGKDS
jgi:hypothetical protein